MTKEELKQEAEIYSYKLYHSKAWNPGEDMLVKAYLAGAEPREKQIQIDAEQIRALQKQNGEFADNVKELEKENAELKGLKDVATLIRANNDTVTTLMQLNNKLVSKGQQLTKAKEIIREFVKWATWQGSNCPNFKSIQDKAEQFLSEVEK